MLPFDQFMTYAADALLLVASLGAGIFCLILSRRLSKLSRIDNGLGGAIAVLSAQVDDMSKALTETKSGSEGSAQKLEALNREARTLAEELELMLAACHDLNQPSSPAQTPEEEKDDNIFWEEANAAANPGNEGEIAVPLFLSSKSRLARVN